MNKLLTALLASAAALTLSTGVLAAEQSKDTQSRDNQTQTQPNATKGKPEQSDSQANSNRTKDDNAGTNQQGSESDPAYAAELKKCDSMQGDTQSKCVAAAKKKAGQM